MIDGIVEDKYSTRTGLFSRLFAWSPEEDKDEKHIQIAPIDHTVWNEFSVLLDESSEENEKENISLEVGGKKRIIRKVEEEEEEEKEEEEGIDRHNSIDSFSEFLDGSIMFSSSRRSEPARVVEEEQEIINGVRVSDLVGAHCLTLLDDPFAYELRMESGDGECEMDFPGMSRGLVPISMKSL